MFNFALQWTGEIVVFFVLATSIISGVVLMHNFTKVVHVVVSVAFVFLALAGIYVLLDAEFVACVQVLVYTGAISILMIFGIMMTRHDKQDEALFKSWKQGFPAIGCSSLFGILFFLIRGSEFPIQQNVSLVKDNTLNLGKQLFTEHVIPFELLSVLLTVALIGAIVFAKKEASD